MSVRLFSRKHYAARAATTIGAVASPQQVFPTDGTGALQAERVTTPQKRDNIFRLTPKQKEAMGVLTSRATHIMLFGGSRSGKTFLFCRAVAVRALKAPNSRHAILRYRFNHIKSSIVLDTWPKMMRLCFPGVNYHLDKTDWYVRFDNGSEVWFGGLDDKERTEKILGQEYVTIYLNECSQISKESREVVMTRLAQLVWMEIDGQEPVMLLPRMYYDCNPPTKAHWTYKVFILRIDLDTKKLHPHPEEFAYFKINPKDNAENLTPGYLKTLEGLSARQRKRFLLGEYGEATEAALFKDEIIDRWRVLSQDDLPDFIRIVVAVDPSGSGDTDNESNDAIGIAVCGLGTDGKGYLLEDLTVKAGPGTWGRVATAAYERHEANGIVGEVNFGGAMVEHVIQTARPRTPFISVHASRGKHVRAEPIAALYEDGRIRHVGYYTDLEDELVNMTTNGYVGDRSPNRADAAIWGFTELFGGIVQPQDTKKFKREEVPMEGSRWAH